MRKKRGCGKKEGRKKRGSSVLIFGTSENALHLKNSRTWIIDGTFFMAPKEYYQILVICGSINSKFCPLLYCFLTGKSENIYLECFKIVKKVCGNIEPINIVTDFEMSLFMSFKKIFSSTKTFLCLFHLGQNIFRKIQKLGLSKLYNNNYEFRELSKMLLSIAFSPASKVKHEFDKLEVTARKFNNENIYKLFEYFKNYFINNEIYKIECWNAYVRIFSGIPLTTNVVESFNKHFKDFSPNRKPSLEKVINVLKTIQNNLEDNIINILLNYNLRKNTEKDNKIKKLKEICKKYDEFYDIYFLKCISYTYNWNLNNK